MPKSDAMDFVSSPSVLQKKDRCFPIDQWVKERERKKRFLESQRPSRTVDEMLSIGDFLINHATERGRAILKKKLFRVLRCSRCSQASYFGVNKMENSPRPERMISFVFRRGSLNFYFIVLSITLAKERVRKVVKVLLAQRIKAGHCLP